MALSNEVEHVALAKALKDDEAGVRELIKGLSPIAAFNLAVACRMIADEIWDLANARIERHG